MSLFIIPLCPSAGGPTLGGDFSCRSLGIHILPSIPRARLGHGDGVPCPLDPPRATVVDSLSAPGSTWRLRSYRFPALGAIANLAGPLRANRATVKHWDSQGPGGPQEKNPREERHPPILALPRGTHHLIYSQSPPPPPRTAMPLLGCEGLKFRRGTTSFTILQGKAGRGWETRHRMDFESSEKKGWPGKKKWPVTKVFPFPPSTSTNDPRVKT